MKEERKEVIKGNIRRNKEINNRKNLKKIESKERNLRMNEIQGMNETKSIKEKMEKVKNE